MCPAQSFLDLKNLLRQIGAFLIKSSRQHTSAPTRQKSAKQLLDFGSCLDINTTCLSKNSLSVESCG